MRLVKPKPKPQAGFTLIEVLVAVAIVGIIGAFVAMSFASTFQLIEQTDRVQGVDRQARLALDMIKEDLASARRHAVFPWIGRNAEVNGKPADLLAFVTAKAVQATGERPESDLQRVVYSREGDTLLRVSLLNLMGQTADGALQTELATGVVAFNVRYFDSSVLSWADQWEVQGGLPVGVLVELTLLDDQNQSHMFSTWVTIPKQAT